MSDGKLASVDEMIAGDTLLIVNYATWTVTKTEVLGFAYDGSNLSFVLKARDAGVFILGNERWYRQVLPVALLSKLPLRSTHQFTNIGSRWHGQPGHVCAPCIWHVTRGCGDGLLCNCCHEDHSHLSRARMRKQRDRNPPPRLHIISDFMGPAEIQALVRLSTKAQPSALQSRFMADDSPKRHVTRESGSSQGVRDDAETSASIPLAVARTFVHVPHPPLATPRRSQSAPPSTGYDPEEL